MKIINLFGLAMYSTTRVRICFSISVGWSPIGILVKPGKSTKVRLRTLGLKIFRWMGSLLIPLFKPATRAVSASISLRTASKSVNLCPGEWRNSAHSGSRAASWGERSSEDEPILISWRTSGRRVTMPEPRGRKSLPTKLCQTRRETAEVQKARVDYLYFPRRKTFPRTASRRRLLVAGRGFLCRECCM